MLSSVRFLSFFVFSHSLLKSVSLIAAMRTIRQTAGSNGTSTFTLGSRTMSTSNSFGCGAERRCVGAARCVHGMPWSKSMSISCAMVGAV
jgi:hypothetical protein